jgi:hypothetical protein
MANIPEEKRISTMADTFISFVNQIWALEKQTLKHDVELYKRILQQNIHTSPIQPVNNDKIEPLDGSVKNQFETAFGVDFSDVKIHTGADSNEKTHIMNAEAFAIGTDIYFKDGRYSPQTEEGIKLLAHELAHVAQYKLDKKMNFFEDINALEYEADKIEEEIGNLRLHSITKPILDKSGIPNTGAGETQVNKTEALKKSSDANGGEGLGDYSGKRTEQMIELELGIGKRIMVTKRQLEGIRKGVVKEMGKWLVEKKKNLTVAEYEKLMVKYTEWVNS